LGGPPKPAREPRALPTSQFGFKSVCDLCGFDED